MIKVNMKKYVLVIALGVFMSANAQVTERNLLTKHYSLNDVEQAIVPLNKFKPFPTTPSEWRELVPASILNDLVKDGEENLKFKFASLPFTTILNWKRKGDRREYDNLVGAKRKALFQLTVAESIEGKGRFMDAIMDGLWSICEETYWGSTAHIRGTEGIADVEKPLVELYTGETATTLALVNYFVGDRLDKESPLLRKRLVFEINKRFFKPLLENLDTYSFLKDSVKINNWGPWIMSNWIATNLLIEQDNKKRSEMLYYAMRSVDRYVNGLGEDGGCDEGPHYWNAAGGCAFDCLEWIAKGTNNKVNIFGEPLLKKMVSYIYKTHIGDTYFVNIGDGAPKISDINGTFLYRIGSVMQDDEMKHFGLWAYTNHRPSFSMEVYMKVRNIENLLTINQMPTGEATYKPLEHIWISDIQLMVARVSNKLFLATHAGTNGKSHNHNDVGDFIIYVNEEPFIIDAGSGTYTATTFSSHRYDLWNMQSQYHNLPTINGIGEHEGVEYAAKEVVYTTNAEEDKLKMNIAEAYPKEAGVISWKRTNSLLRKKEEIDIVDDYEMKDKPTALHQTFMTVADVDLSENGKVVFIGKNDKLVLEYDAAQFSVTTDNPSLVGPDFGNIKGKWGNKVITRVLFTAKNPQAKGTFAYKFRKGE